MNRFDIINRIGDKYRVGNTETGEFSYAQALKTVGKDIKDYQKATTGTQHIWFALKDNFVWVQLEDGADTEAHLHGTIRELVFDNFGWQR